MLKHKELFTVIIVWMMSALGYGLIFGASVSGILAVTCIVIILCLAVYPISKHYDEIHKMHESM